MASNPERIAVPSGLDTFAAPNYGTYFYISFKNLIAPFMLQILLIRLLLKDNNLKYGNYYYFFKKLQW